jgi:hypothetical protein
MRSICHAPHGFGGASGRATSKGAFCIVCGNIMQKPNRQNIANHALRNWSSCEILTAFLTISIGSGCASSGWSKNGVLTGISTSDLYLIPYDGNLGPARHVKTNAITAYRKCLNAVECKCVSSMLYREHLRRRRTTVSNMIIAVTGYLVSLDICIHWIWR